MNGVLFVKFSEICGEIGGEMVVLDLLEKEVMLIDYIEGWWSNGVFWCNIIYLFLFLFYLKVI